MENGSANNEDLLNEITDYDWVDAGTVESEDFDVPIHDLIPRVWSDELLAQMNQSLLFDSLVPYETPKPLTRKQKLQAKIRQYKPSVLLSRVRVKLADRLDPGRRDDDFYDEW